MAWVATARGRAARPSCGIGCRQGPVDVDRVGIVALDQFGIVAVHRPDEIAKAFLQHRVDPAGEPARAVHQLGGEVFKLVLPVFGN